MSKLSFLLIPWSGVFAAAFITTVGAVLLANSVLPFFYDGEILAETQRMTPFVTSITAFPFCCFVWAQVRYNILLGLELRNLVERDRLTDVATRDYFFSKLKSRPDSYGVSLMVDIDHFKSVNDTYGHLAGDDVIVAVADVMRDTVRENDIVCRFGGEEFVVFLDRADKAAGAKIAERIRADVAARVTQTGVGPVRVTVSVGGSLKEELENIEQTIQRADEALYQAKSLGRNRTVMDWDKQMAA
ncbi:GGDEF domain-containing protein [Pseudooctadecabacter jejudonensis]|nr:GGDEF domain-containing protein [Pseudooctadecabacter jejudonensis]